MRRSYAHRTTLLDSFVMTLRKEMEVDEAVLEDLRRSARFIKEFFQLTEAANWIALRAELEEMEDEEEDDVRVCYSGAVLGSVSIDSTLSITAEGNHA